MKGAATENTLWPLVLQAIPTNDYGVYAYCNDGSVRYVDVKPRIQPGTVFEPLQDISVFKSKLTVLNDTAAWDMAESRNRESCIDLDPFVSFMSPAVPDPLPSENADT